MYYLVNESIINYKLNTDLMDNTDSMNKIKTDSMDNSDSKNLLNGFILYDYTKYAGEIFYKEI